MSDTIKIRVYKLNKPYAVIPKCATTGAAGMDLHAAIDEAITLFPGERELISTGLVLELPDGYEGQIRPRSGLAANFGLTVLNTPGTVDADYRGEVKVILINHGQNPYAVRPGDRIAQLVIAPVTRATFEEVAIRDDLDKTERGAAGCGSTGR